MRDENRDSRPVANGGAQENADISSAPHQGIAPSNQGHSVTRRKPIHTAVHTPTLGRPRGPSPLISAHDIDGLADYSKLTSEKGSGPFEDPLIVRLINAHPERIPQSLRRSLLPAIIYKLPKRKLSRAIAVIRLPDRSILERFPDQHKRLVTYRRNLDTYTSASLLDGIMRQVSLSTGISPEAISSSLRHLPIVKARQEFFYRAAAETVVTYSDMARFVGLKDHSTVDYGVCRHCMLHGLPHPRGHNPEHVIARNQRKRVYVNEAYAQERATARAQEA